MTYEIPKALRYREKIAFGLTFKQLLSLLGFGFACVAIFFKTDLILPLKVVLCTGLFTLGGSIAFFDADEKAKKVLNHYSGVTEAGYFDKGARKFLGISDIKDSVIVKSDGTRVAVLTARPINLEVKGERERKALISSFGEFVNAIDFSVQINIRTVDSLKDVRNYFQEFKDKVADTIEETGNKSFKLFFRKHRKFFEKYVRENAVKNRLFYVTIPCKESSHEEALKELKIRIRIVREKIAMAGIETHQLSTNQLITLLAGYFDEFVEVDKNYLFPISFLREMEERKGKGGIEPYEIPEMEEEVEKGFLEKLKGKLGLEESALEEGAAERIIRPGLIQVDPDKVSINKKLNRVLMAKGWPREISLGFLNKILKSKGDFNISMHIHPSSLKAMRYKLDNLLKKLKADLVAAEQEGREVPSVEILYRDTKNLLEKVEKGEEKIFDVSLYVNVKAKDEDELESLQRSVKADLDSIGIVTEIPGYEMRKAFRSTLPLGEDELEETRTLTTSALGECFPFTSTFLEVDEKGIILGTNKTTDLPVVKDIYRNVNPNGLVVGTSGAGKSYYTKLLLSRYAMRGTKIMIIDPQGEYTNLVEELGGKEVELSRYSESMINILDLMNYEYNDKILSLIDAFSVMFEGISAPQKSILTNALDKTYGKVGIKKDKPSTWNNQPPTLSNLYRTLEVMRTECEDKRRLPSYDTLLGRLEDYVDGPFEFFDKQTKLQREANIINFNIVDLPSQAKPVMMYIILDYLYSVMKREWGRKMVVCDEGWTLLSGIAQTKTDVHEAPFLFRVIKTSRKFNLSLLLLVQDIDDLINSRVGSAVLGNTSMKFLLQQDESVVDSVAREMNLNQNEKRLLQKAGVGDGLLISGREHVPIHAEASPLEHRLVSTEPEEVEEEEEKTEAEEEIEEYRYWTEDKFKKALDKNWRLFKRKNLTEEQASQLEDLGYWKTRIPLGRGRGEVVYIKYYDEDFERESKDHQDLVIRFAYDPDLIRKFYDDFFTDEVRYNTTEKPGRADVVFEVKGKRIGIEVETGAGLDKPKFLKKKIEKNNEEYEDWFIVPVDWRDKRRYKKFYDGVVSKSKVVEKVEEYFE